MQQRPNNGPYFLNDLCQIQVVQLNLLAAYQTPQGIGPMNHPLARCSRCERVSGWSHCLNRTIVNEFIHK